VSVQRLLLSLASCLTLVPVRVSGLLNLYPHSTIPPRCPSALPLVASIFKTFHQSLPAQSCPRCLRPYKRLSMSLGDSSHAARELLSSRGLSECMVERYFDTFAANYYSIPSEQPDLLPRLQCLLPRRGALAPQRNPITKFRPKKPKRDKTWSEHRVLGADVVC
jgi:hypothetical protein